MPKPVVMLKLLSLLFIILSFRLSSCKKVTEKNFSVPKTPSAASTEFSTDDEATSSKNHKLRELRCSSSRLSCQSTNLSVTFLLYPPFISKLHHLFIHSTGLGCCTLVLSLGIFPLSLPESSPIYLSLLP